jgi:DNA-binding SARP family transcriptional activator
MTKLMRAELQREPHPTYRENGAAGSLVLICLLGSFRLLKAGHPLIMHRADKTREILSSLAVQDQFCASRERLLQTLWPDTRAGLASQSLNSLIYSLHKRLGDAIGGATPVIYFDGYYRLNVEAGIDVDLARFNTLVHDGDRAARDGQLTAAISTYERAVQLYHGDLYSVSDTQSLIVGEGLRAQFLRLLAKLADHSFSEQDYTRCLSYTSRILSADPCREDAHRLAMRCYVREGQRAQALHQYRVCESILHGEFDVAPEPATAELYRQIRLQPDSV